MKRQDNLPEASLTEVLRGLLLMPCLLDLLKDQQRQISGLKELFAELGRPDAPASEWLDAKAAARYLGISDSTFDKYRYKTTPSIKGYPLDGKILYRKGDLDSFVRLYALKANGLA